MAWVHRAVDVTFALGGRDGLRQFGLVSIDEAFDAAGDRLIGGRQFGGTLSRQAAVPLGICGVGSRRAADVANQPIVGRLGRVPEPARTAAIVMLEYSSSARRKMVCLSPKAP